MEQMMTAPEPIPADHPSLATSAPAPGPIAPVQASPFVEEQTAEEGEAEQPAEEAVNDQLPAQSSEAPSAPATDAASVLSPPNEITPTTE